MATVEVKSLKSIKAGFLFPRFTRIEDDLRLKQIEQLETEAIRNVVTMECEIDELLKFRKSLKQYMDMNVSVNDIVIKSAAMALRAVPAANSKWSPSHGSYIETSDVDISVAVATPNGLITPIVTNAESRGRY